MLCSKLRCQEGLNLILFSHKIDGWTDGSVAFISEEDQVYVILSLGLVDSAALTIWHLAQRLKQKPAPYTLHPAPYTLHPTPFTLHPTPYTLHPAPYTLDLKKTLGRNEAFGPRSLFPKLY